MTKIGKILEGGPVLTLAPFNKTVKNDDYIKKGELNTGDIATTIASVTNSSALITDNFNYLDKETLIDIINRLEIEQINILRGMSNYFPNHISAGTTAINNDYRVIDDLKESLVNEKIIPDEINSLVFNPKTNQRNILKYKTVVNQLRELIYNEEIPDNLKIIEINIRDDYRKPGTKNYNSVCDALINFTNKSQFRIINDQSLKLEYESRKL